MIIEAKDTGSNANYAVGIRDFYGNDHYSNEEWKDTNSNDRQFSKVIVIISKTW